ncbi:MAG: hypothetical protein K0U98_19525 [Deltaproteobacteria bacterium]|nr:hypothetical protein [Deltaproteobacteria bacterium]
MRQIFQIYRNDLRRLWLPCCGWILLILLRLSLVLLSPTDGEPATYPWAETLDGLLQLGILLPILLGLLVLEEPPMGTRSYWLSRPITSRSLMAAKGGFILSILILPVAVSQAIVLHHLGMGHEDLQSASAFVLLQLSFLAMTTWAWATLARTFSRFLVGIFGLSILWGVGKYWLQKLAIDRNLWLDPFWIPQVSERLTEIQLILISLAIIAVQYRSRRIWRSLSLGLAGLIAVVATAALWSWDNFGAKELDSMEVSFDRDYFGPHDNPMKHRINGDISIYGRLDVSPLPADRFVKIQRHRSTLKIDGGPVLRSFAIGLHKTNPSVAREAALGGARILNPYEKKSYWDRIFHIHPTSYERYAEQPGRLELRSRIESHRYEIVFELPFREGASASQSGDQLAIELIESKGQRADVRFLERSFNPKPAPYRYSREFFLLNRSHGTAVQGRYARKEKALLPPLRSQERDVADIYGTRRSLSLITQVPLVLFHRQTRIFDLPEEISDPEGWLSDAHLVRLDQFLDGKAVREVLVEDFRLIDSSAPTLRRKLGKEPN